MLTMLGPLSGGTEVDPWILSKNDPSWTRPDLSDSQSLGLTSRRLCDSALAEKALVALCIGFQTAPVGVYPLLPPQPSAALFLFRHLLLDAPVALVLQLRLQLGKRAPALGPRVPLCADRTVLPWKMAAATLTLKMVHMQVLMIFWKI